MKKENEPVEQEKKFFRAVYVCEGKISPGSLHSSHELVRVRQLTSADELEQTIRCWRHGKTAFRRSVESRPIQE